MNGEGVASGSELKCVSRSNRTDSHVSPMRDALIKAQ
jgi:hypothetical protein